MDFIARKRKKQRIRKKVSGTQERPRVSIKKSNQSITVQAVDDINGVTLCAAFVKNNSMQGAEELGKLFADRAKEKNITAMVFDRNGYNFHGIVRKFAESLNANGIKV